jgi:hypothetical protein
MTDYLKRLIGLSPWSRMHRKAFLLGFEEGMRVGAEATITLINSGVTFGDVNDYIGREGRTIN